MKRLTDMKLTSANEVPSAPINNLPGSWPTACCRIGKKERRAATPHDLRGYLAIPKVPEGTYHRKGTFI